MCVCAFAYNLEIATKKSTMATKKKMLGAIGTKQAASNFDPFFLLKIKFIIKKFSYSQINIIIIHYISLTRQFKEYFHYFNKNYILMQFLTLLKTNSAYSLK